MLHIYHKGWLHFSAVRLSFSDSSYLTSEMKGSIEICVVLDGVVEREVLTQVTTTDMSATGTTVFDKNVDL